MMMPLYIVSKIRPLTLQGKPYHYVSHENPAP